MLLRNNVMESFFIIICQSRFCSFLSSCKQVVNPSEYPSLLNRDAEYFQVYGIPFSYRSLFLGFSFGLQRVYEQGITFVLTTFYCCSFMVASCFLSLFYLGTHYWGILMLKFPSLLRALKISKKHPIFRYPSKKLLCTLIGHKYFEKTR